jgi:diaminohydroxyphosphoribosylaminopyrimidine deaminase/5-amino-6-(5-phosphoribosylamino)uracil reductase
VIDARIDPRYDRMYRAQMHRAIALACSEGAVRSSNPRVGCVILDQAGQVVGEGFHRGAGTAHAEVVALLEAGPRARGGTAVVSLEPCRHVGRTGPCTRALLEAGIARVVFAQSDPTEQARGGGRELAAAGVQVVGGVLESEAAQVNRAWTHWQVTGMPLVTAKCAMSVDGRVGGRSGEPIAITGPAARSWMHRYRAEVDAICIGTGTVRSDDPLLTARDMNGALLASQPLRVVIGERGVPTQARIRGPEAPTLFMSTRNLAEVLDELQVRQVQHLLVEGGPTLCTAFLRAGLVDEVLWWIAPSILGAGPPALGPLADPLAVDVHGVDRIGEDVLVRGRLTRPQAPHES